MHVLTNPHVTPKTKKKERTKINPLPAVCQDMALVDVTVKIKILQCSTLYH